MRKSKGNLWSYSFVLFGVILSLVPGLTAFSQQTNGEEMFIRITAGLGVSTHSDPSMVDYINALTLPSLNQRLSDFSTASEFFITPEMQVNDAWSVGLEYSYFLKSYNVSGAVPWDFSYSVQMPTLLAHYLSPGDGYWLKVGGGIGYAFGSLTEQFVQSGAEESSKASGPAIKVEAVGNTKFDEHFWGSIGLDMRWVYAGSFKGGVQSSAPAPKLDFFSLGVKFGITYQI